uniref:Uncharacterized protein n=1 Tax=Cacopsylla melanoneura TaxID=428564 RepID=A0A8D8TPI3_9HEMI
MIFKSIVIILFSFLILNLESNGYDKLKISNKLNNKKKKFNKLKKKKFKFNFFFFLVFEKNNRLFFLVQVFLFWVFIFIDKSILFTNNFLYIIYNIIRGPTSVL